MITIAIAVTVEPVGSFAEPRNGRLYAQEQPPVAAWLKIRCKKQREQQKSTDDAPTSRRCGATTPLSPISFSARGYSAA
jgi:hypothetical protein